jgi:hypothetical protein
MSLGVYRRLEVASGLRLWAATARPSRPRQQCGAQLKPCAAPRRSPGPVRPARPARCRALAWLMGATTSESMPFLGL